MYDAVWCQFGFLLTLAVCTSRIHRRNFLLHADIFSGDLYHADYKCFSCFAEIFISPCTDCHSIHHLCRNVCFSKTKFSHCVDTMPFCAFLQKHFPATFLNWKKVLLSRERACIQSTKWWNFPGLLVESCGKGLQHALSVECHRSLQIAFGIYFLSCFNDPRYSLFLCVRQGQEQKLLP